MFSYHLRISVMLRSGTFPYSLSAHHNLWQFLSADLLSAFCCLWTCFLMTSTFANTMISCFLGTGFSWNSGSSEYVRGTS